MKHLQLQMLKLTDLAAKLSSMSETAMRAAGITHPRDYTLTTSFPYLARRVGLAIGEIFDRALEPYGVNVSMYRVMAALAEENGQQLSRLSEITAIEMSTLSRLVGAMVGKGLVTRRRPRANGRIVEISLSASGVRLVERLMPKAALCEEVAVAGLSAAEVARLKEQLRIAWRNLDRLEAALGSDRSPPQAVPKARRRTRARPA
jgi:DNA-binding MarR family transcriptional regulator